MLAAQECRLVPAARPIKPVRRPPALLRGHATENCYLFRTGLFIHKHDSTVRRKCQPGKLFDPFMDAARIDFDDDFIYREVARPVARRKIPMKQLLRKETLGAFKEWKSKADKTPY